MTLTTHFLPLLLAPPALGPFGVETLLLAGVGLVVAIILWRAVGLLRELVHGQSKLEQLGEIEALMTRFAAEREPVDLGRIEDCLSGLRDSNGRVEASLRALLENLENEPRVVEIRPEPPVTPVPLAEPTAAARLEWTERITNRLLSEGYTRVEFISSREELAELDEDGSVRVEARRDGVVQKGSVTLRQGRISEVALRPAFSMFP